MREVRQRRWRMTQVPAVAIAATSSRSPPGSIPFTARASMSSAMPMPGGWSMSMAWMSMGHQSGLEHATMFLVMWAVDDGGHDAAVGAAGRASPSRASGGACRPRRRRGRIAAGFCSPDISAVWVVFGAVAYAIGMTIASAAMRSIDVSLLVPAATGLALAACRNLSAHELEADLPAPLPFASGVLCRDIRFAVLQIRGDSGSIMARIAPPAAGD